MKSQPYEGTANRNGQVSNGCKYNANYKAFCLEAMITVNVAEVSDTTKDEVLTKDDNKKI